MQVGATAASTTSVWPVAGITSVLVSWQHGMFTALFLPILKKVGYQCEVEEIRHNTQKEKRIIDTLEPVMNQHRLIVDKSVIKEDAESIKIYPLEHQQRYSLFYQMTRITKDRGCLSHDDRLDCL